MQTARRIVVKFLVVSLVALIIIILLENIIFCVVGRNGWLIAGPWTLDQQSSYIANAWHERFGGLPAETEQIVIAPVTSPPIPPRSSNIYRIEDSIGSERIMAANGLIRYGFVGGPRVPDLPPLPHLLTALRSQPEVSPWMVSGVAMISSDDELWCRVDVAVPFRFREREYLGPATDFLPPSSSPGWRTSHFDVKMLAHNLAAWLLLFGWLFFLGEFRALFEVTFRRARRWRRQGRCDRCGYDRRGLDDRPCPECGTTPSQKRAASRATISN